MKFATFCIVLVKYRIHENTLGDFFFQQIKGSKCIKQDKSFTPHKFHGKLCLTLKRYLKIHDNKMGLVLVEVLKIFHK